MINRSLFELTSNGIKLAPSFTKIPGWLYSSIVNFFYNIPSTNEANCILWRSASGKWRAVVPRQRVTEASVDADYTDSICLVTGERLVKPPKGWRAVGTIHSHGRFPAFFSSVDDASDFNNPGIHCVIGDIKKKPYHSIVASATLPGKRVSLDPSLVIETNYDKLAPYHLKAMCYVNANAETERLVRQAIKTVAVRVEQV